MSDTPAIAQVLRIIAKPMLEQADKALRQPYGKPVSAADVAGALENIGLLLQQKAAKLEAPEREAAREVPAVQSSYRNPRNIPLGGLPACKVCGSDLLNCGHRYEAPATPTETPQRGMQPNTANKAGVAPSDATQGNSLCQPTETPPPPWDAPDDKRMEDKVALLYDAIKHGDDVHKAWLKEAIDNHFAGLPVPPPTGKGTEGQRAALVLPERAPTELWGWLNMVRGGRWDEKTFWETLRTHLSPPAKGADQ